jgi:hypothetical protein
MKNIKIFLSLIGVTLLNLLSSMESMAQCAMCRATVENNLSDGSSSIGSGLNTGILYLVSFPYLAFMIIAYFWYRSSKANYEQRIKTSGYSGGKMS